MSAITLENVSKVYNKGKSTVCNVSFTVADGEFVVLVGPSGCGKTTTLNMIAGLESITSGRILLDEDNITATAAKDRDLAMVFQSYALYPHMSVRENIAFPLKMAKRNREDIAAAVDKVARLLDLIPFLDVKPASLSGGQRQRVAMGRALVRRPRAFLMDEPLSNLDAKLRTQMRQELAELHERLKITTVYVTHDQTEAMSLGDRIVVLAEGIIQQIGTPGELYTSPKNLFVAGFIGFPAMNFLPATLGSAQVRSPLGVVSFPHASKDSDTAVVVGIRPEFIKVTPQVDGAADPHRLVFSATVHYVETFGVDSYVHLGVRAQGFSYTGAAACKHLHNAPDVYTVVARVSAREGIAKGDSVTLSVEIGDILVFDQHSGESLL